MRTHLGGVALWIVGRRFGAGLKLRSIDIGKTGSSGRRDAVDAVEAHDDLAGGLVLQFDPLARFELGADTGRARPDGRNVADELASQLEEETSAGREPPRELARVRQQLEAWRGQR